MSWYSFADSQVDAAQVFNTANLQSSSRIACYTTVSGNQNSNIKKCLLRYSGFYLTVNG